MKHLDDEQLSLMALGEPALTPAEADHLAFCSDCARTLAALERTVHAATIDPAEVELATPGPHNWTAIHQALGLSPDQAQDPLGRQSSWGSSTTTAAGSAPEATTAAGSATESPEPAATPPAPFRKRVREQRPGSTARRWVAMAAAAGIVLGAAAVWAAYSFLGKGPEAMPSPTPTASQAVVIAQAPLQPLESYTANGKALVEKLPDGSRQLVVQLSDGQVSGFREVWVISPDLSKLVSLGVLDGEPGVFAIPEGLDLAEYPIVDVSNEPFDGNPGHSSDSIARGELAAEN
ncbi:anti-sigma factor [Arthrobacter sp. NPDC093128]|uniref:anti-sigma factor n=1 Tax=Arthrobacter sp. NPDC093128 TaxID=3154979 RepID=UPI003449259B